MTAKDQARGLTDKKESNKISSKKGAVNLKNSDLKINSLGFDYKNVSQVINALENPNYKWRTISGIARETGINPQTITSIVAVSDKVVKSSRQSIDGQDLFTTRSRFNAIASSGEKLIGAIKNRLD
jgi:hypothetical protein